MHSTRKRRNARAGARQNGRRGHDVARVVGVRTLIMGCQTIMLIVYSVLTPSVCLHVYSCRLQPTDSRFPSPRPPPSSSSSSQPRVLAPILSSPQRERLGVVVCLPTGSSTQLEIDRWKGETKTALLKARHGDLRGGSYLSG